MKKEKRKMVWNADRNPIQSRVEEIGFTLWQEGYAFVVMPGKCPVANQSLSMYFLIAFMTMGVIPAVVKSHRRCGKEANRSVANLK